MKILSIGEILWDVFDDAERLGGAPFNFAAHAARLGHDVRFLSAVGDDDRGRRALAAVERSGVRSDLVRRIAGQPTGAVRVRVDAAGQPSFTIERPAAYDFAALNAEDTASLTAWKADWVYFGTLHQADARGRALTDCALAASPGARRFYDVNLRQNSYTLELVAARMRQADVLKLNADEVRVLAQVAGAPAEPLDAFCRACALECGCAAVAVTLGERGSAVRIGGDYVEEPGYRVQVKDTVGSGDAFAAAFLHGLGSGWSSADIADFANRAGALVASHAGAIPEWTIADARALTSQTRTRTTQ
ncbi:MAG TPA: carbohydrate kinase [Bryobacteraceae bacterium]|nr:carbohydrate kinase [Bryobacteraceae bacterium]